MSESITCPATLAANPAVLGEQLLACLAESLEAMAFITLMPVDAACPLPAPTDPVRVGIRVRGPASGTVEIAAPCELGAQLAANVMEPGFIPADAAAANADALRELMNVVCGSFLRSNAPIGCEMELPTLSSMNASEWEAFTGRPGTIVVDAEGSALAIRASLSLNH
jgi:hypothetical protein